MVASDVIGTGLGFPVVVGPHGGLGTSSGIERLEQSMRTIMLTYPGERPVRPEFGCRLRDHVFGLINADSLQRLAAEVRVALDRWEPRAEIDGVDAVGDPDVEGTVRIEVHYRVLGTDEQRTLEHPFERLPLDGEG